MEDSGDPSLGGGERVGGPALSSEEFPVHQGCSAPHTPGEAGEAGTEGDPAFLSLSPDLPRPFTLTVQVQHLSPDPDLDPRLILLQVLRTAGVGAGLGWWGLGVTPTTHPPTAAPRDTCCGPLSPAAF